MKVTAAHNDLVSALRLHLDPWRKLTIAVDGVDGARKSSLARYLAWQLEVPLIETDLFRSERDPANYVVDLASLKVPIEVRLSEDRPLIIEGIFVLRTLDQLNIQPDLLIRVDRFRCEGHSMLQTHHAAYRTEYAEKRLPDFRFTWLRGDIAQLS
jgi:hypothetical protein